MAVRVRRPLIAAAAASVMASLVHAAPLAYVTSEKAGIGVIDLDSLTLEKTFSIGPAGPRGLSLNEDGTRYVLATSAQPCCQCYGASFWAGIDELRIGARASDVMELSEFDEGPLPADWIGELERRGIAVARDVLRDEAREVFHLYARVGGGSY